MPFNRDTARSTNGYSTDSHQSGESPTYEMEHLATFTVAKENGIVYPADGMRRLLQLEKTNGIWSQKMHFRIDQSWVLIMDYETGAVMERFPVSLIQEPTAFMSHDPMEIYNNILVFIVGDVRPSASSQPEMHIFQCQNISAQDLVEDLKASKDGQGLPSHNKSNHVPPPPPDLPPPEPPINGVKARESNFSGPTANLDSNRSATELEIRDDETSSTSSEKYEKDVTVLNHCFDDIEKFIARLQHAAAASRELERRQRSRKSKKKDMGDGMLTMRAKPPPEIEFVDIFQKFKLSFNLLAKLKSHIHDPNAPELVHFLFTPLALIVDASHDTHYGPNLPSSVTSPLLTREAINLLMNCVTSKETELWHSLGEPWLIPRDQWKGLVPPYHPVFMDGWSPDYSLSDNRVGSPSGPSSLSQEKRNRTTDEVRIHREIQSELREAQYLRSRDVEQDDSSDYFEYEHQESETVVSGLAPSSSQLEQYTYDGRMKHRGHDEREISHSPGDGSEGDFVHGVPGRDLDACAHSDISADSIERNGGSNERFERAQIRWLDELRNRNARVVQVTYPRTANNDKELTVVRGEFLEVLDDSRKWWKTRNSRGIVAHVPHTIVTLFDSSTTDMNDIFATTSSYGHQERNSRRYHAKDSGPSMEQESGLGRGDHSSEISRRTHSPSSMPSSSADWVRKERLGKKGEFRYF